MTHNMVKFLGLDSELVCGRINGVNQENHKISFGYFIPLTKDEYDKMLVEEPVLLNLEKSAEKLNRLYNLEERFSEFKLCNTSCSYSIGINNIRDNKKIL